MDIWLLERKLNASGLDKTDMFSLLCNNLGISNGWYAALEG